MLRQSYCRPTVRELASGVDGLYLSGRADLSDELINRLEAARTVATEAEQDVPFEFGGYVFAMRPRALGRYRYWIEHPLAAIGITAKSGLPTFRVQTRAEALHSPMGPRGVVRWTESAVTNENLSVSWMVSRIDLHADVQGWQLSGNDRHRFVYRARSLATFEDDADLEGLMFGKRTTGSLMCRIYDKTREIQGNGHDWWIEKWGDKYDPELPVLRIEFEFKRECLKDMKLTTPDEVLDNIDRLWAYATTDWMTYRRPTAHDRPARWPIAAEWAKIQRVSLAGNALPMERIRAGRAGGGIRTLMPVLNGCAASLAFWIDVDNIDDLCDRLPHYLRDYEVASGRSFRDRIEEKRRDHQ